MSATTLSSPAPVAAERNIASKALVPGPAAIAAVAIVLSAWYLNAVISWRQAALFIVGAFAGVVLYHAAFGFTSSWRLFIADRRGAGLRAQMLMLAVTCVVFFPLLAGGTAFGQTLRGSVSPPGMAVLTSLHACSATRSTPRRDASSYASAVAASEAGEPSMPTSTGSERSDRLSRARMTATGCVE